MHSKKYVRTKNLVTYLGNHVVDCEGSFWVNLKKKGEESSLFNHCVYKMKAVASSASVHSVYVKHSSREIVIYNRVPFTKVFQTSGLHEYEFIFLNWIWFGT